MKTCIKMKVREEWALNVPRSHMADPAITKVIPEKDELCFTRRRGKGRLFCWSRTVGNLLEQHRAKGKDILAIGASALVDFNKTKCLKNSFRRGEENVQ